MHDDCKTGAIKIRCFLTADMQNLFGDADDISSDSDGEKEKGEGRSGGMGMVSSVLICALSYG